MPPRTSSSKVPSSRVYYSEPRLRQRRFPSRTGFTVPSTEPPSFRRRTKQDSQRTLTQLHWPVQSSHSSENEDDVGVPDVEEEWQEPRPKKKRKSVSAATATEKRQSTLTQIDFFALDIPSEEEICETDLEDEGKQETDRDPEDLGGGDRDGDSGDQGNDRGDRKNDGESEEWNGGEVENDEGDVETFERDRKDMVMWHDPTSDDEDTLKEQDDLQKFKSPKFGSQDPPFTPRKSHKLEIPSSQSPAATPLTMRNDLTYKFQRSPLQEIPPNVVAQLDMTPVRKPRRTIIEDSQAMDDADDEQFENVDPESDGEPTKEIGVFKTPTRLHSRPQWNLKASRQCSQTSSASPARRRQRHWQASSEPKSLKAIPSSQATTVDLTQPTPHLSPVQVRRPYPDQIYHAPVAPPAPDFPSPQMESHSSPPPLSSPPIPFPFSSSPALPIDSQFPTTGMDDITPMSEIHNSADIVTVSQLLPESMRDHEEAKMTDNVSGMD